MFKNYKPSKNVHYPLKKIPFKSSGEMSNKDYLNIQVIRKKFTSDFLKVDEKKINFYDHHLCHSLYGYFINYKNFNKPTVVVTCDSGGDNTYNSINLITKNGMKKIPQNSKSLIGQIYDSITLLLGMNPSRHQYKLMGLAPYASNYHSKGPRDFFLKSLKIKNLNFIKSKK